MARVRAQSVAIEGLLRSQGRPDAGATQPDGAGRNGAAELAAAGATLEQARDLAARLPRIVIQAQQVAASVQGVHGRRRAGVGEDFWQFRPYAPGEAAAAIDWRRSARDHRLYVRQREWEAAQRLWLWCNLSPSMGFRSSLAMDSKAGRALTLGLGLAGALARVGERIGLLGGAATSGQGALERLAHDVALHLRAAQLPDLPPQLTPARSDVVLLLSDCLNPPEALAARLRQLAGAGVRGHVVLIADPIEESFPFSGQALLETPDGGLSLRIGDAARWGEEYREALASHRAAVAEIVARWGWTLSLHRTDRPASEAALRLISLLSAPRPGAGGGGAA